MPEEESIEALVPADHPLRAVGRALDAALARNGPAVTAAADRLPTGHPPREVTALLLGELLMGAPERAVLPSLLRHELALRWLTGRHAAPTDEQARALVRAVDAGAADPAIRMLVGQVLEDRAVAAALGDFRLRPTARRLGRAVRDGRRSARRVAAGGRRHWALRVAGWALAVCLLAGAGLAGYAAWALPGEDEIRALLGRPSLVVDPTAAAPDRGRHVVAVPVERRAVPEHLVELLLTAEDRRFYSHWGFDLVGVGRALRDLAWRELGGGPVVQGGGSTLTQQLAKNALLHPGKTLQRKLDEFLLAVRLELMFAKDDLLELYLANAYFGDRVNGIELAARNWFGKRARELDNAEAALLVQLLPAPERFRPDTHWVSARDRALALLAAALARHPERATPVAEARRRLAAPSLAALGRGPRDFRRVELRYFRDWVLADLAAQFPGVTGEHRLVLTLDPLAQIYAQIAVERLVERGRTRGFREAAVVVMRPDGTVLALVGGREYGASQFSRATAARRQPGSAFKPVVYLTAVEAGYTASSIVDDRAYRRDGWPRNYQGRHQGKVELGQAFRQSLNGAAVQLAEAVSRDAIVAVARRLGLRGRLPDEPSLALGVGEVTLLELTAAYAVLANGGLAARPTGVLALRSDEPKPVAWRAGGAPERLVRADHAQTMVRLMRGVVEPGGSGSLANIDPNIAGKTGTTQDHRDAWFVGFTGDFVIGIWVGNDDRRPMHPDVTGGSEPARAFRNLLANLRDDVLGGRTTPPAGLRPGG